jgi:hypothetical protein
MEIQAAAKECIDFLTAVLTNGVEYKKQKITKYQQ